MATAETLLQQSRDTDVSRYDLLAQRQVVILGRAVTILPKLLGKGNMGQVFATDHPQLAAKISLNPLSQEQAEQLVPNIQDEYNVVDLTTADFSGIAITTDRKTLGFRSFREAYIQYVRLQRESPDAHIVRLAQFALIKDANVNLYWPVLITERMNANSIRSEILDITQPVQNHIDLVQELLPIAQTIDTANSLTPPIIHRDIKPSSLLRDLNGNIRLSDFGIALSGKVTQHSVLGTVLYYAPERLDKQFSPAVDQYSYAVVLANTILAGADPRICSRHTDPHSFPKNYLKILEYLQDGSIYVDIPSLADDILLTTYGDDQQKQFDALVLAELFSCSLDKNPSNRLYNCRLLNKLVSDILQGKEEARTFGHYAYLMREDRQTSQPHDTAEIFVIMTQSLEDYTTYSEELYQFVTGSSVSEGNALQKMLHLLKSSPAGLSPNNYANRS